VKALDVKAVDRHGNAAPPVKQKEWVYMPGMLYGSSANRLIRNAMDPECDFQKNNNEGRVGVGELPSQGTDFSEHSIREHSKRRACFPRLLNFQNLQFHSVSFGVTANCRSQGTPSVDRAGQKANWMPCGRTASTLANAHPRVRPPQTPARCERNVAVLRRKGR
jgi:hypothetical protein